MPVAGVSIGLKTNISKAQQGLAGGTMRGILLWLVGIPIPVIILLYLFHVM